MKKFTLIIFLLEITIITKFSFSQEMHLGFSLTKDLIEQMNQNKNDELIRINIRLASQFDIQNLNAALLNLDRQGRRELVVKELKDFSERTQKGILAYLDAKIQENQAQLIFKLWINNVITCMASNEVIATLSQRNDIDRIDWDESRKMIVDSEILPAEEPEGGNGGKEITWNVSKVNAPAVWALGYTGAGIKVGVIDSGVNYNHSDLQDHMWTDPSYPYHGYDFSDNDYDPMDEDGHGTNCAGIVAGDGTAGSQTGIAPDATIMALKVLDSNGAGYESSVWAAIQFTVEHGGDVISMSLGWMFVWGPDRTSWRNALNNSLACGIIAAVGAGNEGDLLETYPIPNNIRTPGDCPPPWMHPDQTLTGGLSAVVCVGATNIYDEIAFFSSLGPVTWLAISPFNDYAYNPGMGLIKPDVTAPGEQIKTITHYSNTSYESFSGTSSATPHVAGLMALMLNKDSNLTPAEIDYAIEMTALDLGTAGKDNVFGAGRINAIAAINQLGPSANFDANITNVCTDGYVNFTDLSEGDPTNWSWSFPGGTPNSFSGPNPPTILYNMPGTYDVSLTVENEINIDTKTSVGYISVQNVFSDFYSYPTTIVVVGNNITFNDNSSCNPNTWIWSFPGGTPSTKIGAGPHEITYNSVGNYDVNLIVTKNSDTDMETKSGYISIIPTEVNMTNGSVTTCTGNFYDSGGPSGNYTNHQYFTETFYPATSGVMIRFTFNSFQTESNYDYLYIYNGESTSAPLIGTYHGSTGPGTVTASNATGALTFQFTSDVIGVYEGWSANISCQSPSIPVADFTVNNTTTPLSEPVNFADLSEGIPTSWVWSFIPSAITYVGGTGSNSQNPQVKFNAIGNYSVNLTVINDFGSDSELKTNFINVVPNTYCIPTYTTGTSSGDYITLVQLGTINNATGASASPYYIYYSNLSTILVTNNIYTITLSPGTYSNGNYITVWIDYNQNKLFETTEKLGTINIPPTPATGTINFTVPSSALNGTARMRVREVYNQNSIDPCSNYVYGETEDYNVNIQGSFADFDLTVYLEGPYNGINMNTSLEEYLPLSQPFNSSPWNYNGTESVASIPNPNVVDWVLVDLRDATAAFEAHSGTSIAKQAAFILSDGSIIGIDGSSALKFNVTINRNLFVVVYQRNHLSIMSNDPVPFSNGVFSYNFSTGINQVFGGIDGHKEISIGIWGMIGGDGDANGIIDESDKVIWTSQAGESGYKSSDYNLNGQVENMDKNEVWEQNIGDSTQLPVDWSCGEELIDVRDGQTYNTIQIGAQCWMAENINVGALVQNTVEMTDNGLIEKYCIGDLSSNCEIYGGLYQWNELMQYTTLPGAKGICPPTGGWHLPSKDEWLTLINYLGGENIAGGKLKTTGTIEAGSGLWYAPNTSATNESGFSAVPGGRLVFGSKGYFSDQGYNGRFWSSTPSGTYAWFLQMDYNSSSTSFFDAWDLHGFSARCIKGGTSNTPPHQPQNPQPSDGAQIQPINTILSWTCSDPENDPLVYDIYLGPTNPPVCIATMQTESNYNPGQLNYNTIYYWKIVAHDDQYNSTYGPVWSFSTETQITGNPCPGIPTINYGGQVYNTVQIGDQCWLKENLNIGTMINGSISQTNNGQMEKYCYDNNPANCATYGGLYQWNEMMDYSGAQGAQGICPDGWYIPRDNEWCTLEQTIDPTISCSTTGWRGTTIGGQLKEIGNLHWTYPNTGASDEFGFTVIPSGDFYPNYFENQGFSAVIWSSTTNGSNAWFRGLSYFGSKIHRQSYNKNYGYSVRCIKN